MTEKITFTRRITRTGGQLVVSIPKDVVEAYGIEIGEYVRVTLERVRKEKMTEKSICTLLEDLRGIQCTAEFCDAKQYYGKCPQCQQEAFINDCWMGTTLRCPHCGKETVL